MIKKTLMIFVLYALFSSMLWAETGMDRLQRFMDEVKTFEALFTQEVVSEKGEFQPLATGQITFLRPAMFRWDYDKPEPQQIVSDGKSVWIYDVELEQVTVKPLEQALGATPASILTDSKGLHASYHVKEAPAKDGFLWVELKPKKVQGDFNRILIGFNDLGIQAMDLYDQFGQLTMVRFMDVKFNPALKASDFQFTPPEGADVIGSPAK